MGILEEIIQFLYKKAWVRPAKKKKILIKSLTRKIRIIPCLHVLSIVSFKMRGDKKTGIIKKAYMIGQTANEPMGEIQYNIPPINGKR